MKLTRVSAVALVVGTVAGSGIFVTPAAAQGCEASAAAKPVAGLGGLFKRARLGGLLSGALAAKVGASATGVAEQLGSAVVDKAGSAAPQDCSERPTSASSAAPARQAAPKPAKLGYPKDDIPVTAEIKARNDAFDAFGRYECNDCEGGHAYDSWAQQSFAGALRGYNAWAEKIGAMPVGASLPWDGIKARGVLSITSANPVGAFNCKQVRYVLKKGNASAERDGLFCQGRLNQFDAGPSWVEVY